MRKPFALMAIAATLFGSAAFAQDRVGLDEDERINRALLSASVSLGVARVCEAMEIRQFFGLIKALELRNYARGLGYSDDEINDFINDPVQQKRLERLAWRYMTSNGVRAGDAESHCALGRHEIERRSLSGRLLRDTGRGTQ